MRTKAIARTQKHKNVHFERRLRGYPWEGPSDGRRQSMRCPPDGKGSLIHTRLPPPPLSLSERNSRSRGHRSS